MGQTQPPELPAQFYCSATGREPVREWLRSLDKANRQAIGLDLMRVQFGWPIGMPLVRNLMEGMWEVRSSLRSQRIARLILYFYDDWLVVLHGFIKKTQKTCPRDLALAIRSRKEIVLRKKTTNISVRRWMTFCGKKGSWKKPAPLR